MVNTIITKTTGRNKVVDFRDGLVAAHEEDYANLHGAGGRKGKAPVSVIRVIICDYSNGTGDNSRTVNANIGPELCEQLLEVCKHNIGTHVIDPNMAFLKEQRAVNLKLTKSAEMSYGVLNNCIKLLDRIVKTDEEGKGMPGLATLAAGAKTLLTKTRDRASEETAPSQLSPITIPQHMDYSYSQDRVHAFGSVKEGDLVKVQRLSIFHQTFRNDGQQSNYPWTIKILNARAPVHFQETGATSFSSSGMVDKQEAFIQVSDADMYRMMSRLCHYITAWENTVGASVIRAGLEAREKERKTANASPEQEEDC